MEREHKCKNNKGKNNEIEKMKWKCTKKQKPW
jgi:hypothetical protein